MQLREIDGFGDKTFEQAAGFLRIKQVKTRWTDGSAPGIIFARGTNGCIVEYSISEICRKSFSQVNSIDFKTFEAEAGKYTVADIRDELLKPGRDPRDKFVVAKFREDVKEIADLKDGMELEGAVTNVTNFGAFVDLGVHQDGLVHISELSHNYVQDARQAVKVGDIVKVKLLASIRQ